MPANGTIQSWENGSDRPSAPSFQGPLRKWKLMELPTHFFLLSGIGDSPCKPALECEVTKDTCRKALWRLMVARGLDGRTFYVFTDKESLEAERDERRKIPWGSPGIE